MIILPLVGIVIQEQIVAGIGQLPVQIVPDDDLGAGIAGKVVPEPFGVDAFGRQLALDPDAAVAGFFTQVPLTAGIGGIGLAGFIGLLPAGHFVDQDAAVDAHAVGAPEGFRLESADPADHKKLPGGGLMEERGFVLGEAGGTEHGGKELAVLKDIQTLLELVDDQAVVLVNLYLFQAFGFDISLELFGEDLDGGVFLGRRVGFDQGPVSFFPENMNRLACTGDNADVVLAFFIRLCQDPDLFPLLSFNDSDGLGQDLPDGRFVHAAHLQVPETDVVIAFHGALLVRRMVKDIGSEQRIRRGEVFVFPLNILIFFCKSKKRDEQENKQEGEQAFHLNHCFPYMVRNQIE